MAREDISSESISKNITKLSGAPSPGPYDFARILDRRVNTNKREWKIFFVKRKRRFLILVKRESEFL